VHVDASQRPRSRAVTPTELAEAMQGIRRCGWVWCAWQPRQSYGVGDLDDYLAEAGLPVPVRDGWHEINKGDAMRLTEGWASFDLAYGGRTGSPACEPFFVNFTRRARYFTNRQGNGWNPKTDYTFDAGVVGLDATTIGLLWFADED
jgi:hypothetical protein